MEAFIIGSIVLALVIFPIWAIVKIVSLGNASVSWARRIDTLEQELRELREKLRRVTAAADTDRPVPTQPLTSSAPAVASTPPVSVATTSPSPLVPPAAAEPPVTFPAATH